MWSGSGFGSERVPVILYSKSFAAGPALSMINLLDGAVLNRFYCVVLLP